MNREELTNLLTDMLQAQDTVTHLNEKGPPCPALLQAIVERDAYRARVRTAFDELLAEVANWRGRAELREKAILELHFDPPLVFDGTAERADVNNRLMRMQADRDRLAAELERRDNEEAADCPEDVGYHEYVKHLAAELAAIRATFPPDAVGLLKELAERSSEIDCSDCLLVVCAPDWHQLEPWPCKRNADAARAWAERLAALGEGK